MQLSECAIRRVCMDCGYKWEDEAQTDLGEKVVL